MTKNATKNKKKTKMADIRQQQKSAKKNNKETKRSQKILLPESWKKGTYINGTRKGNEKIATKIRNSKTTKMLKHRIKNP